MARSDAAKATCDSRKPSPELNFAEPEVRLRCDAVTNGNAEVHESTRPKQREHCVVESGAGGHVGALDSQVIKHGDSLSPGASRSGGFDVDHGSSAPERRKRGAVRPPGWMAAVEEWVMSPGSPRAGYHSVTPRIVVSDVAAQVHFLRDVFHATGNIEPERPAELRIGDSLIMVTPATERGRFPAFLYVYVDDADEIYQRALAAGAAPLDTPYGDRRAMVRDPFGNVFQIAHPLSVG